MNRADKILSVGLVLIAGGGIAFWLWKRNGGTVPAWVAPVDNAITNAAGVAADFVDTATGGILKISRMRDAQPYMLNERNVRAGLMVIRVGEGTADANGYRRIFGGKLFSGYADHPRVSVPFGKTTTTAAGAYQFLSSTWDETARIMGLRDFSPASQDLGALGRIAARGALDDVRAGRFVAAVKKMGYEWASLPGSPYGQPTRTMEQARAAYLAAGGREVVTA